MEEEGDDKDDTKRRTRNLSEKRRRDQFNVLVKELSGMVTTNNRKMDKSTVLQTTISFLKSYNEVTVRSRAHDVQEDWKPAFLSNEEFTYLVLEAVEGFVMVFSAAGKIYYASESIASLLGHDPGDVVNKSIFDLTYEADRPNLYNILHRNMATSAEQIRTRSKDKTMFMFEAHLQRGALDYRDEVTYELVMFNGHFRTNMENLESGMAYQHDIESRLLFVCTGRLQTPQLIRDVSLGEATRGEFTSRHSLEWKFLFLDHRAPPIIGYLPFEVLGTSGYDYYHFDDLEKVVTCHEDLMQKGELTSCFYRFLTKGQQWIWLQTRFYITYHQWNSKPEFVVCTHRVVSYADMAKTAKDERAGSETPTEGDQNRGMLEAASEDAALATIPSSLMSEAANAFGPSFQAATQESTGRHAEKAMSCDEDVLTASITPDFLAEASGAFGPASRPTTQVVSNRRRLKTASSEDATVPSVSSAFMSEASNHGYGQLYRPQVQAASAKATSACSSTASQFKGAASSDKGTHSGESRPTRPANREQEHKAGSGVVTPGLVTPRLVTPGLVTPGLVTPGLVTPGLVTPGLVAPQHAIGAQYLDHSPYMNAVGFLGIPPVPLVPTVLMEEDTEMQKSHEKLQQLIVSQQEELRQVKEQLLLARLGILQPLLNVPYPNFGDIQQQQLQQSNQMRSQVTYDPRGGMGYIPHHPHSPQPPQPPQPTHPSHPTHPPHHHMPQ